MRLARKQAAASEGGMSDKAKRPVLGKYCESCQAIPAMGFCRLAGCPAITLREAMQRVEESYTRWPQTIPRVEDVSMVINALRIVLHKGAGS
jgi:hypothetical protein